MVSISEVEKRCFFLLFIGNRRWCSLFSLSAGRSQQPRSRRTPWHLDGCVCWRKVQTRILLPRRFIWTICRAVTICSIANVCFH